MTNIRYDQKGFSTIEILTVIILFLALGVTGLFVYRQNRTKPSTIAPTSPTTPVTETPVVSYLIINEWGVKLPLSENIKDAYYVTSAGGSKDKDGKPNNLLVGLRSLDSKGCEATNTNAFSSIFRALPSEKDSATNKPIKDAYPDGKLLGDYFYAYGDLDSPTCKVPKDDLRVIIEAFVNAEKNMITTN